MVKIAVLNTFVFILGISLGYAFATQQKSNQPAPMVSQNNPDTSSAAETPPAAVPTGDPIKTPKPAGPTDGQKTSLSKLIAELPRPEAVTGDGVITGTVKLPDGRPLEGVLIRASYRPKRIPSLEQRHKKGRGVPKDPSLEEQLMNMAKNLQSQRLSRKEACTDREGKFTLSGLADGRYTLTAYLSGYIFSTQRGRSYYNLEPGSTAEYIAKAVITLPVNVVLPDGSSPEKATIECIEPQGNGGSRHHSERWFRNDPVIQLIPGRYTMKAASNEEDEYISETQLVTLKAGDTPAPLTFQLNGRLGIKGKVVFEGEKGLEQVYVGVVNVPQGTNPDLSRLKQPDKQDTVSHYNDYAYHFKDLAPGTYLLGARASYRGKVLVAHRVEVVDRMVAQDLAVPPADPRDYVVVWVLGPDGEKLQDVSITAGYRSENGSRSGSRRFIKKEDGSHWVLHNEPDEDSDVDWDAITYTLSIRSRQFGRRDVTYQRQDHSEVTVQFDKPAFLNVQVANYAGSGQEGKVSLALKNTSQDGNNQSRRFDSGGGMHGSGLDAQGRQILGPTEPGEYELALYVRNRQHSNMLVDKVALSLGPGDNSATVVLPPLYTLVVLVPEPPKNAQIQLRPSPQREGFWGGHSKVGKEGRCEFPQLPAGDYLLRMYGSGSSGNQEMRITVQGDMEIHYEPAVINAMAVHLKKDDGYLAEAGFQSGDIIIGAGDKEFSDPHQFHRALQEAKEQETVQLLVLRGNRQLSITVEPIKMLDHRTMGGSLEPTAR